MKKQILSIASVLFLSGALMISSCKKDDTTPPVITLKGDKAKTISLNSSYTDEGATATDEEDGDITVTTTGTVDNNKTGTYTLTYTAVDAAGNESSDTRTVTVKNDAEAMNGTYNVVETYTGGGTYAYTQTITASTTVNNRITFSKFGDYAGNTNIYANVTGTTIDLPAQTATNIGSGSAPCDVITHRFTGSGSKSGNNFTLTVTDEALTTGCAGNTTYTQAYTKQ
jgi:hypothetical protein